MQLLTVIHKTLHISRIYMKIWKKAYYSRWCHSPYTCSVCGKLEKWFQDDNDLHACCAPLRCYKLRWKCRQHAGRHVFPSLPVTLFWTTADMLPTRWLGVNLSCVSSKLARQDRCLLMPSWTSHDIAHVTNMSCDTLPTCRHVGSWPVIWRM